MRPNKQILPWLDDLLIRGFEDDDDKGNKDDKSKESEDDDDDEGDDEGEKSKDDKDQGNDGLKSALRKERQQRREYEKELKKLKAAQQEQEDKEKSESQKAQEKATKAEEKATKLAAKLRQNAIDTEIIKIATKMKFRDLDDALKLVDLSDVDVEQDEDDPSDVTIDAKSVEDALKALAKNKPHLIGEASNGNGERSGSKFGGGQKSQEQLDEEALLARYPALRRSSPTNK